MKMILYSIALFAFLNIPKAVLSQQNLNINFQDLDPLSVNFKSLTSQQTKNGLNFSHIRHSEGVVYINDTINQENGVSSGYFLLKPF